MEIRDKAVNVILVLEDADDERVLIEPHKTLTKGVNLDGVNLRRADLKNAKLEYVHLDSADLSQANLEGASLSMGNMGSANFSSKSEECRPLRLVP